MGWPWHEIVCLVVNRVEGAKKPTARTVTKIREGPYHKSISYFLSAHWKKKKKICTARSTFEWGVKETGICCKHIRVKSIHILMLFSFFVPKSGYDHMRTIIISDNGLNSKCAVREIGEGERVRRKLIRRKWTVTRPQGGSTWSSRIWLSRLRNTRPDESRWVMCLSFNHF